MRKTKCPECKGSGRKALRTPDFKPIYVQCRECKGTGKILPKHQRG